MLSLKSLVHLAELWLAFPNLIPRDRLWKRVRPIQGMPPTAGEVRIDRPAPACLSMGTPEHFV
jgi:hypothetical protein